MLSRIAIILLLIVGTVFASNVFTELRIPTPQSRNYPIAEYDGIVVKEYDVFGIPNAFTIKEEIAVSKRKERIEEYIFNVLINFESRDKYHYENTQEYKEHYNDLLDYVTAMKLHELEVFRKFYSESDVKEYYEKKREIYPNSFEIEKSNVIRHLSAQKEKEIAKYRDYYLDSLKTAYGVIYNEDLLNKIVKLDFGSPYELADSLRSIEKQENDPFVCKYKDMVKKVSDIIPKVEQIDILFVSRLKNKNFFKIISSGEIANVILVEKAKSLNIHKREDVLAEVEERILPYLGSKYKKALFSDANFRPTNDECIDYYIKHKNDKTYWSKGKAEVTEIYMSTDGKEKVEVALEMEKIRQKILSGEEKFEDFARFYHRDVYGEKGYLGWVFSTDFGKVGKIAQKIELNTVSDLIFEDNSISIIKVKNRFEPKAYAYDLVFNTIREKVLEEKKRIYKDSLKKEYFKKYNVKIYDTPEG